ncbi:DUF2971 domain-containing protein [Clostridium sp. Marseille-Q2269]|uniref:DUF2971 domain-containing protein n=1 Tax=Clostridium sp. Marseille-Q2269 TaxID=2942205 RepID=UPI00207472F4|nr:DUF2971 domain-containing protein [Clostridium sp. Marseille-Q2269]
MNKPVIDTYINKFKNKENIFRYELDLYQCKNINKLYYYTSISTLENIISKENIWLSNSKYLNDSTEIDYTNNLIYEICNGCLNGEKEFDELFKQNMDILLNTIDIELRDTYILSLTENTDSLALWSNYSNYDGYNLGFNYDYFQNIFKEKKYRFIDKNEKSIFLNEGEDFVWYFGEVIYNKKHQQNIIKERVEFLYKLYESFYDHKADKDFKSLIIYMINNIAYIATFFKDESFKEEKEHRLVFRIINKDIKKQIVKHRISNRVFIPYIELRLNSNAEGGNLPIEKVTIGPKNNLDIAEMGLRSFLESEGYFKIIINKSKIPLRY